jgi:hypothetical protein
MNKFIEKKPVDDQCEGCNRIESDGFCTVYAWPEVHWTKGKRCPMATHTKKEVSESKFIDPLKASKKSMKRR